MSFIFLQKRHNVSNMVMEQHLKIFTHKQINNNKNLEL
jgi:hypothetical protein